jgi:cytochrome c oxidase subunit 2
LSHAFPSVLAFFAPESGGSPNANEIVDLYKITLVIALIIFFAVEGGLVYALIKFRKRKGAVASQIHGNTRLEVGWTAGAAVVLIALGGLTFAKLSRTRRTRGRAEPRSANRTTCCTRATSANCLPTAKRSKSR